MSEKHIDLFTGIGGFTLAARWNGIETEVMVEKDERCRQFLERTYPGMPIFGDIRDFDGSQWTGAFILTAGVPCQPASRAGKQGGKEDDRWLWGEAIRIVGEAKPDWCLFENPPGIYDVGIDGILSDLERIGYETGIVEVPACAVNSPQRRARVWIVAHSETGGRREKSQGQRECRERNETGRDTESGCCSSCDVADATRSQDDSRRNGLLAETEGCRESGNASVGRRGQGDMADIRTMCQTNSNLYCDRAEDKQAMDGTERMPESTKRMSQSQSQYENGRRLSSLQRDLPADRPRRASCDNGDIREINRCDSIYNRSHLCVRFMQGSVEENRRKGDHNRNTFNESYMVNPVSKRGELRRADITPSQASPRTQGRNKGSDPWSNFIWTPCADGKLRRTPDDTFGLVDGLHRSILAALGNSIVPQVAYEIIKVIKNEGGIGDRD